MTIPRRGVPGGRRRGLAFLALTCSALLPFSPAPWTPGGVRAARADPGDTAARTGLDAAGVAAAGAAALAGAVAGPAVAGELDEFDLRRGSDRGRPLRALAARLTGAGVGALARSAGQRALGRGCGAAAGVPGDAALYCWNGQDSATSAWIPQGVTSSSDAAASEHWGGRLLLVSWYSKTGIRVTFVNPARGSYQHVLLVDPRMDGGRATYADIGVHAGGIAWFGRRLYVADTSGGLREFDMTRIYDLSRGAGSRSRPGLVGLHGGKYYGHGYRYVMPQTGSWHYVDGRAPWNRCVGEGPLRTSWTAIDRTESRPLLIAGEYCSGAGPRGRVATWPLDEDAGLTTRGGVARASWAAYLPVSRVQGGVSAHGYWWFSHNRDTGSGPRRGTLLESVWLGDEWGEVRRRAASYGPEDLSCFRGQHRVWTVAEHARRRALWGAPASACTY